MFPNRLNHGSGPRHTAPQVKVFAVGGVVVLLLISWLAAGSLKSESTCGPGPHNVSVQLTGSALVEPACLAYREWDGLEQLVMSGGNWNTAGIRDHHTGNSARLIIDIAEAPPDMITLSAQHGSSRQIHPPIGSCISTLGAEIDHSATEACKVTTRGDRAIEVEFLVPPSETVGDSFVLLVSLLYMHAPPEGPPSSSGVVQVGNDVYAYLVTIESVKD